MGDDTIKKWILGVLGGLGIIGWLAWIIYAGKLGLDNANPKPDGTIQAFGVAAGVTLATITGDFLGVSTSGGLTAMSETRQMPSFSAACTIAYLLGILIAVGFFIADKDRSASADVIQTSLATLGGLAIGAISVLAGKKA